jgi:hypothetical protein
MTSCIRNRDSSEILNSSPAVGMKDDEKSLIENIATAYEEGYNFYREYQIIDKPVIEAKAAEMFSESYLLQSWFKTGAITAISLKSE